MIKQTKYIHVRHWEYWWGVYGIGQFKNDSVSGIEFSITDDQAGEEKFFCFDFYTIPALEDILAENEFMEPDNPDYPCFLEKYHWLKQGAFDYFIGSLYYEHYTPKKPPLRLCHRTD